MAATMNPRDAPPDVFKNGTDMPPFPKDLPIAEIPTISYKRVLDGDVEEIGKLMASVRTLGFFRADLRDADVGQELLKSANKMFELSAKTFALPWPVKMQDSMLKNQNALLGYKFLGASVVDKEGNRDGTEQYWIGCGDIDGNGHSPASYNHVIKEHNAELREFARLGKALTDGVMILLSASLALDPSDPNYLTKLHSHTQNSGTHVRLLKSPANAVRSTAHLQPHTDWGTLTVLFNALGGLQIYVPETVDPVSPGWRWIKPEPGTAIVNLGDAMVAWSDGEFKSAIHRVMQPPGEQSTWARYSLAYFCRPNDDVLLKPLGRKQLSSKDDKNAPCFKDWATRRAKAGIAQTYTEEMWEKGQGTEAVMSAAARVSA